MFSKSQRKMAPMSEEINGNWLNIKTSGWFARKSEERIVKEVSVIVKRVCEIIFCVKLAESRQTEMLLCFCFVIKDFNKKVIFVS